MLADALKILVAVAALWGVKLATGYDLLGERGPGDYIMLLGAPLATGLGLTVYCKGRMRWAYGVLAVTTYCFGMMIYMGSTGYAAGETDATTYIMGITALNWSVLALFAGLGGGLGGAYYKIRELNEEFGD